MLNPTFKYIALDFETTGLDIVRDEPIQIGIVHFDHLGNIVESFQSLLKPENSHQQLKKIVGLITGLSVEQLQKAPKPAEILGNIQHFFGPQTVIIGHNISFDITFLQRFFPTLQRQQTIDTFSLAQSLIHYAPSYALEVLGEKLSSNQIFNHFEKEFGCQINQEAKFHDALFDAKLSSTLFWYLINRIHLLGNKYPILWEIFQKNSSNTLHIQIPQNLKSERLSSIPALKKIAPANTRILNSEYDFDLKQYKSGDRYRCDHLNFKNLLQSLAKHQKLILSFSNQAKFNIAKNLLNEMGIKNLGFLKPEQTFNKEALGEFMHKKVFNYAELLFALKYFSHVEQGLGVLELNSKENYEIYTATKDQRENINYPLILTTHGGLFAFLDTNQDQFLDYGIIFLDTEWRYKNYNFYQSSPYDPNYTINYIDMLIYKYTLHLEYKKIEPVDFSRLQGFQNDFVMFVGILGQETKKFFTHTDATNLTLNPIRGNIAFFQSNKLFKKILKYQDRLKQIITSEEFETLWKQIDQIQNLFQGVLNVEKKMYDLSKFYFLYSQETSFTNRDEFTEKFIPHHTLFLSHNSQDDKKILAQINHPAQEEVNFPILKIPAIKKRIQDKNLKKFPNAVIFILSVIKAESKEIFESLIEAKFDKEFTLLVENITGGSGKNIFKAQQQGKTIIIGGYNFLLQLFAQKVAIFDLIVYNNKGKQQEIILQDIRWYGDSFLPKQT